MKNNKSKNTRQSKSNKIEQKVRDFQKKNPEIANAMKMFEISMSHYEQTLKSIEPTETYTSSSTKVLN